jgi:predicted Zn-dependent protease
MNSDPFVSASLRVLVRDPSGSPIDLALVILSRMAGGMVQQGTTQVGQVEFSNLVPGLYSVQVVAAGYETTSQTVNANGQGTMVQFLLRANADASASAAPSGLPILSPKVSKLLTKAVEALRASKPAAARSPLEEAYRLAPAHPYVNCLYGVYDSEMNDWPGAEAYWQKALNIYPKHAGSLFCMGEAMLRKSRYADATSYLNRAIEVEPTAWRPHALLAQALLNQQQYDQAVHEANRALELGHGEAARIQPLLARALAAQGNKERAIGVLQNYLRDWPADSAAQKMLDTLRPPAVQPPAPAPTPPAPGTPPLRPPS